jgi:uroporphyrinogen decarboxylase
MKLLNALNFKNTGSPPVWLMRQAGRYMASYQALRKRFSLIDMFHDASLIHDVTMLPIHELDVDAAILFSDILMVLDGLGKKWDFVEGVGPVLDNPFPFSPLQRKDPNEVYAPVIQAILELKRHLKVPLLGFAGAPFTVASYLVEGKSSKDFAKIKHWMASNPKVMHETLESITEATIEYLHVQIQAGVDAVQIFDSWASILTSEQFEEFSLPYLKKIRSSVHVPLILFSKGSNRLAKKLASLNPTALSLDWSVDMKEMRSLFPELVLQGNLDPSLLFQSKEIVIQKTDELLEKMEGDPGYIFNLGHGILPLTPYENVKLLVDRVKTYHPQLRAI